MKKKKIGYIAWGMRYNNITTLIVSVLVLFGVVALFSMPRNEFPDFTIRQGLVIGVYPGANSAEVEEQLTKQVENYIFGYKEVNKAKTYSESKEGMMIIYVELNDNVTNADEFWSKMKHGLNEFKSSLPSGVLALMANSDFGDTSAMLITLSSDTKGYKEMESELKKLKAECRKIAAVSKIKDYGIQKEKIYVNVKPEKLNEYNIKSISLLSSYMPNGMITPAGTLKGGKNELNIHFPPNFESEKDLANQIVFSDPFGNVVRLKDIATIERRDQDPDSYIRQNEKKTILLSIEMQQGNNIVEFGKDVQKALTTFKIKCPKDIDVHVISNLPQYVDDAVSNFMKEFMIAIFAVILVVMLLLPKRVASIAGFTVPIAVLITLGILNFIGVELNTVSLAGLIIVLGMIVDNSIVVIDNYVEKKDQGFSSWHAAIKSARELVTPVVTATLSICAVYIPLGIMLPGTTGDFVRDLPATICTALVVSVLVALFVVPYLNFFFIKKGLKSQESKATSKSFLERVQGVFDAMLEKAFRNPKTILGIAVAAVVLGLVLFATLDQRLFPEVERNQFAVEVYLPKGASLGSTSFVMDSLERTLQRDKRVTTVTSFVGTSSPRFHTVYAPNMPGSNYGQLMVNTIDNDATKEVCEEYTKKFAGAFPNAYVKWKILALETSKFPIEVRITGDSIKALREVETQVDAIVKAEKGIKWIHCDWEQKQQNIKVELDEDKATRMGYSKGWVSTSLLLGLNGMPLTTIWENDYPVRVELKQDNGDTKDINYLGNQTITSPMNFSSVPLRTFAKFSPEWTEGTIVHRNGTRTLTVQVDVDSKIIMASKVLSNIQPKIGKIKMPEGTAISYGGDYEGTQMAFVPMGYALMVSIVIIFFILLLQFKKVKLSLLVMSTMLLGLPGASVGLWIMHYPFSVTAFIGITSLCGIVVRNGIILIDYLEELRVLHGMSVKEAALAAGKRRMRPIFLTSAAASIGVIPMILSRSPLWGPLGTVICFGLLISMVLTLFVLPVLYTLIYKDKRVLKKKHVSYTNTNMVNKVVTMVVVIVATGSLLPIKGQAQNRTLSIDSCKSLALQNNKKIKDADFDVKTTHETKKNAYTNYFPKISAMGVALRSSDYLIKGTIPSMNLPVYDGNPANLPTATQYAYVPDIPIKAMDYMNMASITAIQPVYSGGRIINGNKLAKIGYEASLQKKLMSTTEVMVKTENIYWNTIALQDKSETLNSYEKLLKQLLSDVQVSVKAGLIKRTDLLRVQLKLNELQINKLKLNNGINLSKMALCQHIGIPYDSLMVLVPPAVSTELPQQSILDKKSVIKNRNEYQLLNKALDAEKLQKKMVLGEHLPQVALGAMAYKYDMMNSTSSNALAFVTVSVPISDWWGGSHKLKEKQYKIEQASNKLDETTELLSLQMEQARNELNETYFQIGTSQVSIDQANEYLKVMNDNYQAGISSMSDLLEAQAMYQEAKNQYTDAVCTYKIKMANYLSATGDYK